MHGATRSCLRFCRQGNQWPLVSVAVVVVLAYIADSFILCCGAFPAGWYGLESCARTSWIARYLIDVWLLVSLGLLFLGWLFLRVRYALDDVTGLGFVLASFGLTCRFVCDLYVHTLSAIEEVQDPRLPFLAAVHRHGGLVAFATGLGLVAWSTRQELRLRRRG